MAAREPKPRGEILRSFPAGFLWGTATAAYQVEGGYREEGRGTSIWDTFSHLPGKVRNGDTGDVSTDHFHRYKEDIALMQQLGTKGYRFSISWSRVFPDGTGTPNPKGLDFYLRLLDSLQEAGIAPYCTLFHWDLPQALEDRGGWRSRDTALAFGEYCSYVTGKLADRISHFMTMNEMWTFVEDGYGKGTMAPGLKLAAGPLAQLRHNVCFAHGTGVQAIRAAGRSNTKVGIADSPPSITPVLDAEEHVRAARIAMKEESAGYLNVVMEGRYTDAYLKRLGADAPKFTAGELKVISSPLDFVGLNVYFPTYVRAAENEAEYAIVPNAETYPHMISKWLAIGPESIYWTPKLVAESWNVKEIYITENGCSVDDQFSDDGEIYDTARVMYLKAYLTQLQRGVADGVPVRGYFLWSLLDNFEWSDGYGSRFGITHVDFRTLKRTPKLSFEFYKHVIAQDGLR
jgi:beta-glucosidase